MARKFEKFGVDYRLEFNADRTQATLYSENRSENLGMLQRVGDTWTALGGRLRGKAADSVAKALVLAHRERVGGQLWLCGHQLPGDLGYETAQVHDRQRTEMRARNAARAEEKRLRDEATAKRRAERPMLTLRHRSWKENAEEASHPWKVALYFDPETGDNDGEVDITVQTVTDRTTWTVAGYVAKVNWSAFGAVEPAFAQEYAAALSYAAAIADHFNVTRTAKK